MIDYRQGYEFYKNVCKEHKITPINFHYYLLNLSQEQLEAYNELAIKVRRTAEYEMYY